MAFFFWCLVFGVFHTIAPRWRVRVRGCVCGIARRGLPLRASLGGAAAGTHREGVREGIAAERNDSSSLSTAAPIATAAGAAEAVAVAIVWVAAKGKARDAGGSPLCVAAAAPFSRDVQIQPALLMRPAESLLCSDLVGCSLCCGRVAGVRHMSHVSCVVCV